MVHKNTKLVMYLAIVIILSSVVLAADTTDYFKCIKDNSEQECENTLCVGNKDSIQCQDKNSNIRNFVFELYPLNCDPVRAWNNTEEMQFKFNLNLDSKNLDLYKNTACGENNNPFSTAGLKARYIVPYDFLNFVDLYKNLYVDSDGWTYLKEPKSDFKQQLKDYYTDDELNEKFRDVRVEPMVKNTISIFACTIDCDYNGASDNQLDGSIDDKWGATRDYTYSKRFIDFETIRTWEQKNQEIMLNEECKGDFELSFIGIISSIKCFFGQTSNVAAVIGDNLQKIFDPDIGLYSYEYISSKKQQAHESFVCKYPKSEYSDEHLKIRVECTIGNTWESIYSMPKEGISLPPYAIFEGGDDLHMAKTSTTTSFFLNSTSGQADFEGINYTSKGITVEEALEDWAQKNPSAGTFKDIEAQDEIEEADSYFIRDLKRDKVIMSMVESTTYIFSVCIMIFYLIQIALFLGMFTMVMNGFKSALKAIKDVTFIKIGGKN